MTFLALCGIIVLLSLGWVYWHEEKPRPPTDAEIEAIVFQDEPRY